MTVDRANLCIYCLAESTEGPPEHVVPEVLGCPEGAVLRQGEVCESCNHGLGHLDQALADSFDFARFFANQPAKKGRGPSVTGRRNIVASVKHGEPVISLNFGPGDVTLPGGRVLKAPSNTPQSVRARLVRRGRYVEVNVQAQAFQHPKFPRAVHKVALGAIAVMLGRRAALDPSLDNVRQFVRQGAGPNRPVLCRVTPNWQYSNTLWPPYTSPDGYCIVLRLCGIELVADCTPNITFVPQGEVSNEASGCARRRWVVVGQE